MDDARINLYITDSKVAVKLMLCYILRKEEKSER